MYMIPYPNKNGYTLILYLYVYIYVLRYIKKYGKITCKNILNKF